MSPTKSKKKAPAKKAVAKKAPAKKAAAKPAKAEKAADNGGGHKMPKHGQICHLEFVAPDIHAAGKTYGALFGWQVFPHQPTEIYFQAHDTMGGCILEGTPTGTDKTLYYVAVDDIATTIAKAEGLGATVVKPKWAIPGNHGFCATLRMPEGNTIGLWCMT